MFRDSHERRLTGLLTTLTFVLVAIAAQAGERVELIKRRGFLTCGVSPGVAGFAEIDGSGGYIGFDIDICRAVAAAIVPAADNIRFRHAASIHEFLESTEIDVVSRRLTWSLERDTAPGVLFGPVVFYDGQGFLVARRIGAKTPADLSGAKVCVEPGTSSELRLGTYFREKNSRLTKVLIASTDLLAQAFDAGRCDAYTADTSELGSIRSKMPHPDAFDILPDQISKEPLAPLVRSDDKGFWDILRSAVFALITAEELGISSDNLDRLTSSDNPDVKRLLGITPGNGTALGLDDRWAYRVIKRVGNYAQIFDRNIGAKSAIRVSRGLNRLWTDGGLLYAPPLR